MPSFIVLRSRRMCHYLSCLQVVRLEFRPRKLAVVWSLFTKRPIREIDDPGFLLWLRQSQFLIVAILVKGSTKSHLVPSSVGPIFSTHRLCLE